MENKEIEMRFFEFNDNSYYALIGVKKFNANIKAQRYYYKELCDEECKTFNEFRGKTKLPKEITKNEAFIKFMYGVRKETITVEEAIKNFEDILNDEENLILIDGCLI